MSYYSRKAESMIDNYSNYPPGITDYDIDQQCIDDIEYCECGNVAIAKCDNCFEPLCNDCMNIIDGKLQDDVFCAECFEEK